MRLFTGLNLGLLTSAVGALLLQLPAPAQQVQTAKPALEDAKSAARSPLLSSIDSSASDLQSNHTLPASASSTRKSTGCSRPSPSN